VLKRFFKFIANNPLAATIVGTVIGGWLLTQLLAMKAPDVGGVIGMIGRWLRAPTGATRADTITLVAVSILLGFVGFAAMLLGQYQRLRRRSPPEHHQPAAAPEVKPEVPVKAAVAVPAAISEAPVPHDFSPSTEQARVMARLLKAYPRSIDLDDAAAALVHRDDMGRLVHPTRAHAEHTLDQLREVAMATVDRPGHVMRRYTMTPAGKNWILARLDEDDQKKKQQQDE
jgi:hypothetical protein